ncbi:MAG: hypothetical protein JXR03_13125 [Cyclobacteriaceae bacterium]
MREKLEKRLSDLKIEEEKGKNQLNELAIKKQELTETVLRIQGAIQVLEEELVVENGKPINSN